jgi:NADH-quinone oxidoreductase subunit M
MIEPYLLTLVWMLPLLTSLVTLPVSRSNDLLIKKINVAGAGINLALVIWLTFRFIAADALNGVSETATTTQLQFSMNIPWFEMLNVHYLIGVDALSMLMMLLTSIIIFGGVFASWSVKDLSKEFFVLLNVLVCGVFGVFVSFDLFTFFLFYEVAVLPMYMLIAIWGTGKKEYSAMKLTLMLVGGSALVIGGILALYFESGLESFDMNLLAAHPFTMEFQNWAFPLLFVGFAVLGAMFPFHTWSPDGHASAPTAVSMLHAGVLMKLGGYGCLRVAMYILPEGAREWMPAFLILIAVNVAVGAFIAIRQKDLKYITAYSSVSHLGLVLLGLAVLTFTGLKGSCMQMISHGLLTGLFFCLIGMIYGRTHTRMVDEMGGLMKVMPFLSVAFVIAGLAGLGLPGLSGFVAEATIFVGAFFNTSPIARVVTVLAILSITTTAVYVIRSANQMLNGPLNQKFSGLTDATFIEKIPVVLLVFCLIGMGVFPGWIADLLDGSVRPIFNNLMR